MKLLEFPRFTAVYILLCLITIVADHFHLAWTYYLSKPIIMIFVMLFFRMQTELTDKKQFRNLLMAGFALSALGDFLLLFVDKYEHFFLFGLVAFLLSHICYTTGFISQIFDTKTWNQHWGQLAFSTLIVVYGAEFFILNRNYFGSLTFPVLIYCMAITVMGVAAVMRDKFIHKKGYYAVVAGSVFFIISDSLLATNKFIFPVEYSGILILSTYFIAQYLIVTGCTTDLMTKEEVKMKKQVTSFNN